MKTKIATLILAVVLLSGNLYSCTDKVPVKGDGTGTSASTEETTAQNSDETTKSNGTEVEPVELGNGSKSLLYFNDPGHIISCLNKNNTDRSQIVTKARLDGAVTEATDAGFDVFVNEIYGMVPWYPSEVLPVYEHINWFHNVFGGTGSYGLLTYANNGNDFIQVQLEKTHEENKLYFLSYRMNDLHNLSKADNPATSDIKWHSKFYIENPQYRIGENQNRLGSAKYMLDFQYKAVRDYKLAMIYELIENYDIDGLLLDFMRAPAYFNLNTTTEEQRVSIITEFVASVKAALDKKTEKTGKEYYFGVVIPMQDGEYGDLGLNINSLHGAGVGMFVFWDYYFSLLGYDLVEDVKTKYPDVLTYVELSQATSYRKDSNPVEVRYTTDEQFYTCAYTAYSHKADGIAVFNFPFYRNWQYSPERGLGYNPPFEIIGNLKDTKFLGTAAQDYFIGFTYNHLNYELDLGSVKLTDTAPSFTFGFDMKSPSDGWREEGILILEASVDVSAVGFTVKVNGVTVAPTKYTGVPYDSPYKELIGIENQMKCFTVPYELLNEGDNVFTVTKTTAGDSISFTFIELAIK